MAHGDHAGHGHGLHGDRRRGRAAASNQRRLAIALGLAAAYMVAEAVGGWLTNSLALLADAGHMLSDVSALGLGLAAVHIAQRPSTPSRTYGYKRTEILAALLQGVLLAVVAVFVFLEAIERLGAPREVLGGPMLAIATGGLLVNVAGLAILNAGRRDNLNVRGAWLHVMTDALGSVGAIAAGTAIWLGGAAWADPAASILIAALVVYSSASLVKEALDVLMEAAPAHIDVEQVQREITELAGVIAVHDLHVWTITSGMVSLSGHVVTKDGTDTGPLLQQICNQLRERFGIDHSTIQIEPEDFEEPGEICSPP